MPNTLKNLKLNRIDLVDAPANPGARVVLVKRDALAKRIEHRNGKYVVTDSTGTKTLGTHDSKADAERQLAAIEANKQEKTAPSVGAVHVNRPSARFSAMKRSHTMKKSNIFKQLIAALKKADDGYGGGEGDGGTQSFVPQPGEEGHEDAEMQHINGLEALHQDMGKALEGLPPEHPMHGMHKALGEKIAEMKEGRAAKEAAAHESADDEAMEKAAAEALEKSNSVIAKRFATLEKAAADATARAESAEKVAKAEQNARELAEVKTDLKKFAHVTIDVEKMAPIYKKLKDTDADLYKSTLEQITAANEVAKQAKALEQSLGSNNSGAGEGSAWAEICAEADKIIAKGDTKLTKEKARNMVMDQRKDLTKRYYAENGANDPVAQ